jgi:cation:H+ antiporter
MVESAVSMATAWGMSELVIGLTIVAVGTSLPELASSLMAAWRKEADIAVGNVIGSNLFNLLFILGITGTLQPLPAPRSLVMLELPAMLLLAMALYPMMRGDLTISRREGALLLGAWVVFVGLQLWFALG